MPSKKRKRGIERPKIHPKNRYADKPPDFSELASLYPSFAHYVFYSRDGRPRIDWTDFNATRELTRVLLLHDHGLNWWIPDGQLCPTVPNRSNYIHWIEDLLASDIIVKNSAEGERVRGLDIGTGTNCIYPLLGASLLGWNFVGTDVTNVAQEWAEKNVASNPHISELIEIRKIDNFRVADASTLVGLRSGIAEQHGMSNFVFIDSSERTKVESPEVSSSQDKLDSGDPVKVDDNVKLSGVHHNGVEQQASTSVEVISTVDKIYQGPPILLGVVKEGEKFDFCMCNPPFFESMEESGLNPKTSCGGTAEEMVCPGGERAFITRIIEDSVALKQAIRWYTSMVGKKSNLKFLLSKLREVGVTVVKTTEFVQGKTCRWGLAWSFMTSARNIMSSHIAEKHNLSFMLEGLQRQAGAFNVLQSVDFFFRSFGASCVSNTSTFTVDVTASDDNSNAILNDKVENPHKSISLPVFEPSSALSVLPCSTNCLSFRISLFQQIPGTLLVKGSLQQRDGPISGSFSAIFQKLEEFLKQNFCKKASTDNLNQIRAR